MNKLLRVLTVTTVMAAPLFAGNPLGSGNYQAKISPPVDMHMASNIEKGLDSIQEIDQIHVSANDSTASFHVKEGQNVDFVRLQNVLQAADPNAQFQQLVLVSGMNGMAGASGTSTDQNFTLQRGTISYVCTPKP
jgi:hypothetical protein